MARNDLFWDLATNAPQTDPAGNKTIMVGLTVMQNKKNKKLLRRLKVTFTLDGVVIESKDTDTAGKVSFTVKHSGNDKPLAVFTCFHKKAQERKVPLDFTASIQALSEWAKGGSDAEPKRI